MTEHELCARLVAKGFEERTVEAAINDLRRLKLIDDAAFARAWVEERMRLRPVGREMLDTELSLKGVAEEIRDIVINETFSEIDPLMVAIDALRKKMAVYKQLDRPTALRRMTGFLIRRGFDEETSLSAAETIWKEWLYLAL
jgi:regulatory protein